MERATTAGLNGEPASLGRTQRERLLAPLLHDVDALAARGVAAMRDELIAYAQESDRFLEDVLDQLRSNYALLLVSLIEGQEPTVEELAFQRGASMRRARAGFALEDYLSAHRVAQRVLWEAIVEHAQSARTDDRMVLMLAAPLMRYADFATRHAARVYVEFREYGFPAHVRQRRDLLERLLAGDLPARGPLAAAAERYGLGVATPTLVAVAVPLDGGSRLDAAQVASTTFAQIGLHEHAPLVVVRSEQVVTVVRLGAEPDPEPVCRRLEGVCEDLRRDGVPFAVGVGTIALGTGELGAAFREATAAVRFVGVDGGVAALTRVSPWDYLILNADATTRRLIGHRLVGFLDEDRRRGGTLRITIRAYSDANLSLKETAARLHVHANTAQYRLRRVAQLTGLDPRRFHDLRELLVAIAIDDAQIAAP